MDKEALYEAVRKIIIAEHGSMAPFVLVVSGDKDLDFVTNIADQEKAGALLAYAATKALDADPETVETMVTKYANKH